MTGRMLILTGCLVMGIAPAPLQAQGYDPPESKLPIPIGATGRLGGAITQIGWFAGRTGDSAKGMRLSCGWDFGDAYDLDMVCRLPTRFNQLQMLCCRTIYTTETFRCTSRIGPRSLAVINEWYLGHGLSKA